jgi:hypothetical protein
MPTNLPQRELDRFMTEIFERFMRLMPANDLTLIILKGHLLVEEQMDKFIEASLGDAGQAFSTLKLSFIRKLEFARQLHRPKEPFASVWNEVKELNDLGNKIAHNPEIADLDQRCAEFVKKRSPQPPSHVAPDPPTRLVFTIGNIVAAVAGLCFGRELMMSKSGGTR